MLVLLIVLVAGRAFQPGLLDVRLVVELDGLGHRPHRAERNTPGGEAADAHEQGQRAYQQSFGGAELLVRNHVAAPVIMCRLRARPTASLLGAYRVGPGCPVIPPGGPEVAQERQSPDLIRTRAPD